MIISVVIPCRNEHEFIEECISSVYLNVLDDLHQLNVIVVDGLSDDGTREIVQRIIPQYKNLYLVDNPQQLTPFAFNLGIHFCKADYYQIVGARQILSNNYLSESISIFLKDSSVWCVGGNVENFYINKTGEIISKAMSTSFGMGLGNFRTLVQSGYTDTVGTPMYPAFVFDKIGYFDEELIRNQDDDFNFRVTKASGKIWFEKSISLKYYVRGNYRSLFKQFFQYGYWKVYVNKKHREVTTIRQLIPPLFVLYLFLLPILFFVSISVFSVFFSGIIFYFLLGIHFSIKKASTFIDFLGVFKTFPILHLSYGIGYFLGIIHFFILKKTPSNNQKSLSR